MDGQRKAGFWLRAGGFALALLAVLALVLASTSDDTTAADGVKEVEVKPRMVQSEVRSEGTVRAAGQVSIYPEIDGVVTYTNESDKQVAQGQTLIRLDDRRMRREVREAKAAVWSATADKGVAESRLERARVESERARRLAREELIPREDAEKAAVEYESAKGAVDVASAKLEQARLRLESAQENLKRATISAPFAGMLLSMNAEIGQPVGPMSAEPLAVMAPSLDDLQVRLEVNEVDISRIRRGQPVTLATEANTGAELTGEVARVELGGRNDGGVNVYRVLVAVDPLPEEMTLLPGMNVRAHVDVGTGEPTLALPLGSLSYQPAADILDQHEEAITSIRDEGRAVVWTRMDDGEVRPVGVKIRFQDDAYAAVDIPDAHDDMKVLVAS